MLPPESQFPHLQNGDEEAVASLQRYMHIKALAQDLANGRKAYNLWWLFLLVETYQLVQEKRIQLRCSMKVLT